MDNKIVSTTYVPLHAPYQIIKYGGDIAMQIGTLIVTIQKEGNLNGLGYKIETHSHPVVSYDNKYKTEPNRQLSSHRFLEGAVWNYVEVKDVTTICLTNARLSWQEFIDFMWRDITSGPMLPTIGTYWALQKLCGGVEPPPNNHYTVHFEIYNYDRVQGQNAPFVRSSAGDIFALQASAVDEDDMCMSIHNEITTYIMALRNRQQPTSDLKITYETDNPECESLVKSLNSIKIFREPLNASAGSFSFMLNAMQRKK